MYLALKPVLSLYATSRLTGLVVSSGSDISHITPIYEGYALQNAILRMDSGSGRDLSDYLMKMLNEIGYNFITSAQEIVNDIKEKLCYVALDYDKEMRKAETSSDMERNYELPDGKFITVVNQRFICSEVVFKPHILGRSSEGLHKLIYESIMKCDMDIRREMYENIILSGGNMMFDGMVDRMQKEMSLLAPLVSVDVCYGCPYSQEKMQMAVAGYIRRRDMLYDDVTNIISEYIHRLSIPTRYLSWIGGSMLGSVYTFNELCISKDEYDTIGPDIVQRKCF
eukprot:354681_1